MNFDELWEELRAENPELIDKVDQRVAEILSLEKQRGCPPDCNPGFCDDPDEEICDRCWASYEKRKPPMTHADCIRSMTDEELAELWWERVDCGECPVHKECRMTGQDCKRLALDWLRQEAIDA